MTTINELVEKKNRWLASQVDVKYPTAESLRGRDLYREREKAATYGQIQAETADVQSGEYEIYEVDFHRLTVMFAQFVSEGWNDASDKACVLEFLAQIILSDEHKIYLGFQKQVLLFAAIMSADKTRTLFSDITITSSASSLNKSTVAGVLASYLNISDQEVWFNQ
ncbi:flavodoxin [Vibrio sp. JC009]|uniref:flavodoxin n=1 Tax=Vibrio sp. JC009 TaxID=2912314 RepID=UPI0023AFDC7F|nr:flavodoxin [Vibrio sp. JC009]WED24462.1 flavodoxin [Vibrio sp. JC009]